MALHRKTNHSDGIQGDDALNKKQSKAQKGFEA